MNQFKRSAAVKKYGQLLLEGKSLEEIKTLLEAEDKSDKPEDGKKYNPEEIVEILAELDKPAAGTGKSGSQEPAPGKENANKSFEEWTVDAVYKTIKGNPRAGTKDYRELIGFELLKKGKTTAITPDRAELLNGQSENSKIRYYEAGTMNSGKTEYLPGFSAKDLDK